MNNKKMNKTIIPAALAAILTLSSCSDKGYWEEFVPDGVQYGILSADQSYTLNGPTSTIAPFTVMVSRGTTQGAVSLPVSVVTDQIFLLASAPATVDFADGSSEAYITVTLTPDYDMAPYFNPVASVQLQLGTDKIAPSATGEWNATVTFANSKEIGTATLTSQLLAYLGNGGTPGAAVVEKEVTVWAKAADPACLMIENPYGTEAQPHTLDLVLDEAWQTIDWTATDALGTQALFNTGTDNAPVYLSWGDQSSEITADGMTLKFYTVTGSDGTGFFPSQYQWVEHYKMPEGWNATGEEE